MDNDDDNSEALAAVVTAKIAEYEDFVEKVLKAELQRSLEAFRREAAVLEQCRELRENIDLLVRDGVTELETMVELGCQFYVNAFVPDTSRIFVDVGLGFRLELTLEEAREFLEHKEACLRSGLELRKRKTASVKADIHEALHLLDLMLQVQSGRSPWLDGGAESLISALAG
mmetsp:Transcript_79094/g.209771  ORF Transcript_79094/g.209771 Transcript_79094/m.209771 type:complete len:172 (+) Transcript_79094:41-556(+)